jgi:glycosyltransferase involved in cell wall biosynthesis
MARLAMRPLRRRLEEACRAATAITATGEPFLAWALGVAGRDAGPFDRAIPLAYDATPPDAAEVARANAFWDAHDVRDDGTFTAAFVGTMNSHCELDTVIDVARRDPRLRFVFCGTGARYDEFRARARGLSSVVMPGWIGRAQIWTLMQRSAVGLAPYAPRPTFDRNLTNKMVEYLSAGLPIVTAVGGLLAELIKTRGCGVRYTGGRVGVLHSVLRELAEDPDRLAAMQRNAKAVYEERFRAQTVYADFADLIEALAQRGKVPSWRA